MIYRLIIYPILVLIVTLSLELACFAQSYPQFNVNQRITDLSGQLSIDYLQRVDLDLTQYDFPVRVVYLNKTQNVKLAKYAHDLFMHWKLPANEMLMVVATDRRKMGVHAGADLKAQLQEDAVDLLSNETPDAIGTPLPGETRDPAVPLDVSSEFDHLELISEAITQVQNDLQQIDKAPKPSSSPLSDESQSPAPESIKVEQSRERPGFSLDFTEKVGLAVLIGLLVLGVVGVFMLRFLKRWRKDQSLVDRFAVEGQAAYELLEQTDRKVEAVMPDLHGYEGSTEKTLNLFIKTMLGLRETYAEMFADFDSEIAHLNQRQEREDAISFFRELELKQEEGEQLHQQALNVLKNLKDVRQSNQQIFEQGESRGEAFASEVDEIKKSHVGLHLTRTQQIYRQHLLQLKALEKKNQKDPLGVEKSLKIWRKEASQIEQETRALPHLWQQFKQDLKKRITRLEKTNKEKNFTPVDQKQLSEVVRMHEILQSAIMQGDLKQLDRWNNLFTQKLQDLESRY